MQCIIIKSLFPFSGLHDVIKLHMFKTLVEKLLKIVVLLGHYENKPRKKNLLVNERLIEWLPVSKAMGNKVSTMYVIKNLFFPN